MLETAPMSTLEKCHEVLPHASKAVFESDPRVQAFGVALREDRYEFLAVRNVAIVRPLKARTVEEYAGVPVRYHDSSSDVLPALRIKKGSGGGGWMPEQRMHADLRLGLQIQNYDDDNREGRLAAGEMTVGTLGLFVRDSVGDSCLLSNNHVIAGDNRGTIGDQIQQEGDLSCARVVATLSMVETLQASATTAHVTGIWNKVDAALARVDSSVAWAQEFLAARSSLPTPTGKSSSVKPNDRVFKVGRTTGPQWGRVVSVSNRLGPVKYDCGDCWFEGVMLIQGTGGGTFCDAGDSGAAVFDAKGNVVGLLFAGNATDTYACPINEVLTALCATL